MATAKPRAKIPTKRAPAKRRPRKAKAGTRGLTALECRLDTLSGEGAEAKARIAAEGGFVLGAYSDPLGKNPLILAVLPIEAIEPTPFQRDLPDTHNKRHADILGRTGMFLAPVIALDERVAEVVKQLKAKGFVSPYLKSFVIARSNPLRFMKEAPELVDLLNTIRGKVERFNVDKIKQEDIVASGGGAPDDE